MQKRISMVKKKKEEVKRSKNKDVVLLKLFVKIHCISKTTLSPWGCQVCTLSSLFHQQRLGFGRRQHLLQLEKLWVDIWSFVKKLR